MKLKIVDGFAWVASHPEKFFIDGKASELELASHICCDAVHLDIACTVLKHEEYWVLHAKSDWLELSEHSVQKLFTRIVPAPEQGANSMRSEVIAAAYASELATFDGHTWLEIRGEIPPAVRVFCETLPNIARLIVLRINREDTQTN